MLMTKSYHCSRGWSGGAKVLGKLPVPGSPTNLDHSRARAYCTCSRCGWGLFGHNFSHLSLLFSFSLSQGDGPIQTEILSQRAVKPKTTNQPTNHHFGNRPTYTYISKASVSSGTYASFQKQFVCQIPTSLILSSQ